MTIIAIDLTRVAIAEDGPMWLHAFPVGQYTYPVHGFLTFTPERLQRIAEGVNHRVCGVPLVVDREHPHDSARPGNAAGWVEHAEVRGNGLWIAVALADEVRGEVRRGTWRYLSPEFGEGTDPRTGLRHQDVLRRAALTNRPFPLDLRTTAASEHEAIRTPTQRGAVLGLRFGDSCRRGSHTPAATHAPATTPAPTPPTELASLTQFMAVLGCHLVTATFDRALERAALEYPQGYAVYRRSTQFDGRR
jgi:hypothetical protein